MQEKVELQVGSKKKVLAEFSAENTTSDSGLLLLKPTIDSLGIIPKLNSILQDPRDSAWIEYKQEDLLSQRFYQLLAGYEDLNDSKDLKVDPILNWLCDRKKDKHLASASTLNRLENRISMKEIVQLIFLQVDLYLKRNKKRFKSKGRFVITLDLDPTDVTTYGDQQLSLFNGYYREKAYLPMVITDGDNGDLICALLRKGNVHATYALKPVLRRVFERIEKKYPSVIFKFRADSGFQSEGLLKYLDAKENLTYSMAAMSNKVLESLVSVDLKACYGLFEKNKEPVKQYFEVGYKAQSWSRYRRIAVQIEVNKHGHKIRYVVTKDHERGPQKIKEDYNQRSNVENRIKEIKGPVFGSRMSCNSFKANSFRFLMSCFSYIVYQEIRKKLEGTPLAGAYVGTIREKLIKVAGTLKVSVRRVLIKLPNSYPYKNLWQQLAGTA